MNGDMVDSFREILSPVLMVATILRRSSRLGKLCRRAAKVYHALPTWVEVRWWSLLKLLRRIKQLGSEIEACIEEMKLTPDDVKRLAGAKKKFWSMKEVDVLAETPKSMEEEAFVGAPKRVELAKGKFITEDDHEELLETGHNRVPVMNVAGDKTIFEEDIALAAEEMQKQGKVITQDAWDAVDLFIKIGEASKHAQERLEGNGFGLLMEVNETYVEPRVDIGVAIKETANARVMELATRGWQNAMKRWNLRPATKVSFQDVPIDLRLQTIVDVAFLLRPSNVAKLNSHMWDDRRTTILENLGAMVKDIESRHQNAQNEKDPVDDDLGGENARKEELEAIAREEEGLEFEKAVNREEPLEDAQDEVGRYLNRASSYARTNFRKEALLEFWDGAKDLPNLRLLAFHLGVIPATSCACERAFSKAGRIMTASRTLLGDATMESLVILRDNKEALRQIAGVTIRDAKRVRETIEAALGMAPELLAEREAKKAAETAETGGLGTVP
jgi:hypothetical protein